MGELTYHEAANLFPLLEGDEFDALVSDIKQNGLLEPICLYEGKILDGRNRYRACIELGIEPKYTNYRGTLSPLEYVISKNLHRRHLTSSQRAVLALDVLPLLEAEAKERQGARTDLQNNVSQIIDRSSRASEQAAKITNTNRQYVSDAKRIAEKSPELLEQVRTGELTIPEAKRQIKLNEKREVWAEPVKPVESLNGPFGVIYADPPWRYDFSVDNADTIENHYPTMTLDAICAIPVAEIAAPDAVLFLWATSPKLAEALAVMSAWGFEYRTNMVWDKEHIGMGYYARQQHELLLIGTKGKPGTPLQENRPGSVVRIKKTAHSKKPAEFAEIIERMYPHLPRVELFCRSPRDGWSVWGNEV